MRRLLALVCLVGVGCSSNDECGPGDAPSELGIERVGGGTPLDLRVTSATTTDQCAILVEGEGISVPAGSRIALCIPRPDQVATFGLASSNADVQLLTLNATQQPCTYTLDQTIAFDGTAHANGLCSGGEQGFALELAGTITMTQMCGASVQTVEFDLAGTVAVPGA